MSDNAWTDCTGLRRYNGLVKVAIGTGWGFGVGDAIEINFSCGTNLTAIVGDIKANVHTCERNKRTLHNDCYLEFIVCTSTMDITSRRLGNMAQFLGVEGHVVKIEALYF